MNFLWFFRNAARGRRRRHSEARGGNRLKETGERADDVMMSAFQFWCAHLKEREVGPRDEGLALERFGDERVGGPSFAPKPSLWNPRTYYCVVIWCPCWRAMNAPSLYFERTPQCNNFSSTASIFDAHGQAVQLLYVGGGAYLQVVSVWRNRNEAWEGKSRNQEPLSTNLWTLKHSQSGSFVLSSKLLFLDALGFNWWWDPSIVTGAGWGCSHQKLQSRLPW